MAKSKRQLASELSNRFIPTVNKKMSKFVLFVLKLLRIDLKPIVFGVGDLLIRKQSEDQTELYEIIANLYDTNLDRVILVKDYKNGTTIAIYENYFSSFKVFTGVVPGTMVDPNDI